MAADGIYAGAGPWARVQLPRGQDLRVIVTGRRRVKDGLWYEVEVFVHGRIVTPAADNHGVKPP
ncbi:hypothetical protein [Streptomyces sp. RPT161]|uniref:hypothetical protein n=1 Tax=Streptomyces sp. RPT161 TaxID=3015993 RepID=UPI0022B8E583|nr:hypothetical protein [Streptomyces sp. RPT161]